MEEKKRGNRIFSVFQNKKNTFNSVFGHIPLGSDDFLNPDWHRGVQLPQVLLAEPADPQLLDGLGQLGDGVDVILLEVLLHIHPAVFNGVQVGAVPKPVDDTEVLGR